MAGLDWYRLKRLILVFFMSLSLRSFGQEPQVDATQMPRIAPTELADALDTFQIRPGFKLVLAAAEPDVVDPIAMAFDADGGMYVVEMRGYSERRDDRLGRIRYLRDIDGDGRYETATVFKDGLRWPTGIVCYKGGVFVGATPDLFYLKDLDGDGVCDSERVVFTGFGTARERLNMQALFNSFQWGPDNRIWGATAASGGTVSRPDDVAFESVELRGSDFSFDPELLDLRPENGTAQYGMSFDSQGRRFICSNSRHAIWVAYERKHVASNPFYELPNPLVDIADDGGAAPVYRISPDEPWRIVRTRWRVSGVVKGMVEGGGRVSGYFTSASGIHAYWGGAYGASFRDNLFVGDVGSNLVHRKQLIVNEGSIQPIARRPQDERETEFLRSSDNWFRPVSFATGPDGCLYICDMYRETIEHPWSLPEGIKKHVDLNSGNDRGRIYRVEPEGFKRPRTPRLSDLSSDDLETISKVSLIDWERTTARRLLYERGKPPSPIEPVAAFQPALRSQSSLMNRFTDWRDDPWLEAAMLNSLRSESDIADAWSNLETEEAPVFERKLARMSGRLGSRRIVEQVASGLLEYDLSPRAVSLLSMLKRGVEEGGGDWERVERLPEVSKLMNSASIVSVDRSVELDMRIAALALLGLQSGDAADSLFMRIIRDREAPETLVTDAALGLKDRSLLLPYFDRLTLNTRRSVLSSLIRNAQQASQLLVAIESGDLGIELLSADDRQSLRKHFDSAVQEKASDLLPKVESRSDVVARYERALEVQGDARAGEAIFRTQCIVCHQTADGSGANFGPPAVSFKTAGRSTLLGHILDPNSEVAPQYQAFQFTLNDGRQYVGMIAREDNRRVTLSLPGGETKTFARVDVAGMTGLGRSLMPEGLEQSLTVDQMSDLLTYLSN